MEKIDGLIVNKTDYDDIDHRWDVQKNHHRL